MQGIYRRPSPKRFREVNYVEENGSWKTKELLKGDERQTGIETERN